MRQSDCCISPGWRGGRRGVVREADIVQVRERYSVEYIRRNHPSPEAPPIVGAQGVLVLQAHCNDEVCRYFSQRGNGVLAHFSGISDPREVRAYIAKPCQRCGEQPRIETSSYRRNGEAWKKC